MELDGITWNEKMTSYSYAQKKEDAESHLAKLFSNIILTLTSRRIAKVQGAVYGWWSWISRLFALLAIGQQIK